MAEFITLDSSVIVAALRKQEEHYEACRELLEKVKDGAFIAVEPFTVMVEVGAAIKRRTGSQRLSERVIRDIRAMDTFFFLDLDAKRAQRAVEIAQRLGLRGMDAGVVQVAEEFNAMLVSLDNEMMTSSQSLVNTQELTSR